MIIVLLMERFLSTLIVDCFACGGSLTWVTVGIDCVLLDVWIPISCVEKFTWELDKIAAMRTMIVIQAIITNVLIAINIIINWIN